MAMRPIDVALEAVRFLSLTRGADEPTPAPTDAQIAEAHALLGRPLPPSYLDFIAEAGTLMPPDWDLYWVGPPDMLRRNLVVANQVERDHDGCPLPEFLIAFFDDDTGDQYCFDTRRPDEAGEYPVVLWDRDRAGREQLDEGLFVVADDFLDWVKRYIADHF
ncbi:MAG: SMI1/KNR4 family protein [Planctomycetota bacterium]